MSDGKLRIKASLSDGGTVELFEYVTEASGQITTQKYSFHWQDAQGKLVSRWDNAPHHNELPHAPHHLHTAADSVQGISFAMNMLTAIETIESKLK